MLHVNDDMDEVFRKAAEEYPLNTGMPDWEGLRKKMEDSALQKPDRNNNSTPLFLILFLLLLLPAKILFNDFIKPQIGRSWPNAEPVVTAKYQKPATEAATAITNMEAAADKTVLVAEQVSLNKKPVVLQPSKQHHSTAGQSPSYYSGDPAMAINNDAVTSTKKSHTTHSKTTAAIIPGEMSAETASTATAEINKVKNIETPVKEAAPDVEKEKKQPVAATDKKKDPKKNVRHFYAGIIGGPDMSTVKLQSVKKTGFGFGIVAGYTLNNRWSFETGLLLDKKYYSTDGKYFNTKNIPMPNYVTIDHANGSCNMLEIPLNVRYAFKSKARSGWFVSAGVASYLMKKEYYNYDVTRYGVSYSRDFTYTESRNSFLSVMSISGGYTHTLGKIGNMRIEPYIKLPLKKVGIGSLPIQSAGINIGITRSIF